jgi:hypothetical protein
MSCSGMVGPEGLVLGIGIDIDIGLAGANPWA